MPDKDRASIGESRIVKIVQAMKCLTDELKLLQQHTAGDKDFILGNHYSERDELSQIKSLNSDNYWMATALLDVYKKLGPIELALAVSALLEAALPENRSKPTKLKPAVVKIFSDVFSNVYLQEDIDTLMNEDTHKAIQKKSNRIKAGAGIVSAAFLLTGMGLPIYKSWGVGTARAQLNEARTKLTDMKIAEKLHPEHRLSEDEIRQLIRLEEIDIPELLEKSREKDGNMLFTMSCVASALITGAFATNKKTYKWENGTFTDIQLATENEPFSHSLSELIKNICKNAKPQIVLPDTSGIRGRR